MPARSYSSIPYALTAAVANQVARDMYSGAKSTAKQALGYKAKQQTKRSMIPRSVKSRYLPTVYTPSSIRQTLSFEASDTQRWNEASGLNYQTLSKYTVLFPPARVGTGDLNYSYENGLRKGPRVLLKGLKLWMELHTVDTADMEVHICLIQKTTTGTSSDIETDFFTNHQVGETQSENFVSQTTTYDEGQRYKSINSERYRVYMHRKINMGPEEYIDPTDPITTRRIIGTKEVNNKVTMEKYFKINQVFEFDSHTQDTPRRPLFLLAWVNPRKEDDLTAQAAIAFSARNVLYFSDMD